MDSESSWEAHSITEEILAPSSDNESNSDSDSSKFSSPEDDDQQQYREDQPKEVRGAEPYRFEPLTLPPPQPVMPEDHRSEDEDVRCTCGKCVVQTIIENYKCCKEVDAISNKMLELQVNIDDHKQCLTQHDWFEAVVPHIALIQYQKLIACLSYCDKQRQNGKNVIPGYTAANRWLLTGNALRRALLQ